MKSFFASTFVDFMIMSNYVTHSPTRHTTNMSDFESPLDALAYLDTEYAEHADLQAQVQSLISDEMDQMRRSGQVQDYLAPYPLPPLRFVRSLSQICVSDLFILLIASF
jgi:hypothetical protein